MRFVSTRPADGWATLSQAIIEGIAPQGGLYVPERLPVLSPADFPKTGALDSVAHHLLRPFVGGDPLEADFDSICREAFDFPAPLVRLNDAPGPASVLELYHGPTCAFKDFGARFLAASLERIHRGSERRLTVLVATSGDTGGAVAAAFHRRLWVDVVLLYPKGLVSPRQAHQLACWGDNVRTFAVLGTFDDCQRMVKEAFRDPTLMRTHGLSSANSINLGRLLPQMVYYASASLQIWRTEECKPNFIIPSGNLGNAVACVWAREMGLPVGEIVLATNENRTITDYLQRGEWQPRPSVSTLASAMDVGNPSNMERLRSGSGTVAPSRVCVFGVRRRDQDRDPRRRGVDRPCLVSAHRDGGARLPAARPRTRPRALGAGRNGTPGKVQRQGRTPDRAQGPRAAGARSHPSLAAA